MLILLKVKSISFKIKNLNINLIDIINLLNNISNLINGKCNFYHEYIARAGRKKMVRMSFIKISS